MKKMKKILLSAVKTYLSILGDKISIYAQNGIRP